MTATAQILLAFDEAWEGKWESLRTALEGVGEEEAAWQADAYAGDDPEEGWPPPGTIAWQVAHLAHCKRYYTAMIHARTEPEPPPVEPRTPLPDFGAELEELRAVHAAQRAAIASLADAELSSVICGKSALDEFLAMTTRHDIWHAAQIALARRLYRTK